MLIRLLMPQRMAANGEELVCAKPQKIAFLVNCFDASSASLLKETLGRASAANWKSDDNIDVEFVFSQQNM
jgi:hypothetical protein